MSRGGLRLAALRNLVLAVTATAVVLLALELAARWRFDPPRYHDAPLELHASLGFRGVPHYSETASDEAGEFPFALNAEGWRGRALPANVEAPAARIAFFGDSFLVGRALRDEVLLTNRVGELLAARGVEVETYNFSAIDYGTAQQLLLFRQVAERVAPDAVVLALYTGNDLVNNEPGLAGATDVSAGDYIRPYLEGPDGSERHYLHPVRARLRHASRLFAVLERRLLAFAATHPRYAWLRPFPAPAAQNERLRLRRAPREGLEVLRAHDPGSPWERAWERTFGLLRAFRREAEAVGARFLVVVIPLEEQVLRSAKMVAFDWASRNVSGVGLGEILDWSLPERRFAEFFAAEGMQAVLLRGPLRQLAEAGTQPYGRDRHLSAAGHARVAQEVAAWWRAPAQGAPGAPPVRGALDAAPIDWVPPARDAPLSFDFRDDDHARYLGDGWLEWRPASPDVEGGWRIGPRSMAVVPDRGGDVVLRGHVGDDVVLPTVVTLELAGRGQRALAVEAPGVFELRFARPPRPLRKADTARDYAVVLVGQRGALDAELRVQQLSIEPPRRGRATR
jgi:hypothetical protein